MELALRRVDRSIIADGTYVFPSYTKKCKMPVGPTGTMHALTSTGSQTARPVCIFSRDSVLNLPQPLRQT